MQRCKAKSKRSGEQCKNYALKNWRVCRMHGARGGPKSEKGYLACKNASIKHGMYSQESQEELKALREILRKNN